MKILGLCGSLRHESRCLALLEAMRLIAEHPLEFSIFEGLGDLPLFNPDNEPNPSMPVLEFWRAISQSELVVIASPEYAHGITGTMKNALDWLVGYVPFTDKPVAAINPSHRANHAHESLLEILRTMNAQLIAAGCVRIPVTGCQLSAAELARDDEFSSAIRSALAALALFHANAAQ